jgi:hypothetical protein
MNFSRPYREHLYQVGGYGSFFQTPPVGLLLYADVWTGATKWALVPTRFTDAFRSIHDAWLAETDFERLKHQLS